jgi:hypothetical protein
MGWHAKISRLALAHLAEQHVGREVELGRGLYVAPAAPSHANLNATSFANVQLSLWKARASSVKWTVGRAKSQMNKVSGLQVTWCLGYFDLSILVAVVLHIFVVLHILLVAVSSVSWQGMRVQLAGHHSRC